MVLSARLDALRKMATDAFGKLGISAENHPSLLSALQAMESDACHAQLAATSDNDPALATILKKMLDATFDRLPDVKKSDDEAE
jgi:hypothetical protein